MVRRSSRFAAGLAFLTAAALAFASCGGDNGGGSTSTAPGGAKTGVSSEVAAQVPSAIKAKGTLTVAADATYPPNEFISDGRVIGMDSDLAKALGDVMGLEVKVVNATFDSIIPGLAAGKYDLGVSSFTDTKEREKTVDFVTYFSAGTSFYVNAEGGPTITTLADLCGHNVAVEKGTVQADDAAAQDKKCKAAGKAAVTVLVYPDQNGANLALSSRRGDVGMADSPVAAYLVKQSEGRFKLSGSPYGTAPYGIAIPKDNGMAKPLLDALKVLMADGRYRSILERWGVADGAISTPAINGAQS